MGAAMNPSCQHHQINNDTAQCEACGEQMISRSMEAETVLSAPNAAACTNPECSGDIADRNCANPHGLYAPDRSREQEVVIGVRVTYECERCRNDRTVFTPDGVEWECGQVHLGRFISARPSTEG